MKLVTFGGIFASILLAQPATQVNGKWMGTLEAGPQKLRLALDVENGQGAMISIDQGSARLPIEKLDVTGASVKIDVGIATYDGTLSGEQISGTFHQSGMNFPLVFRRVDRIEEPRRPQNPQRPFPYVEEEVTFKGGGGVSLAGTLTYPKTGAPFPAVLLLTGSGPQDRDEAIMGHRPFLVLSDYLTRLGLAVLRVDDRGMGKSSGDFSKATYEDKVADALAGVELLRNRKEIDGRRIGLLGHSEGGAIAEIAASRSKDVAFIVMMAGPGVPGDQLMKQQGIDIVRANGGDDATVKQQVGTQGKMFQILREEKDPSIAEKRIRETLGSLPGAEQQAARRFLRLSATSFRTTRVRWCASYPALSWPLTAAWICRFRRNRTCPRLQPLWRRAKAEWQVVQLPELNRLFQTAKTGNVPEYSTIDETISPSRCGRWATGCSESPRAADDPADGPGPDRQRELRALRGQVQSDFQLALQCRPPVRAEAADKSACRTLTQQKRIPVIGERFKPHLELERLLVNIPKPAFHPKLPQFALAA
jgi:pimeloyl-ACP methyl ester carboxylesterase